MLRDLGRGLSKRLFVLAIVVALTSGGCVVCAQTPDEGGVSFDGGGQEVLQSIFVPYMANAPFSLTLAAEWSRPMNNGGTFTPLTAGQSSATAKGESTRSAGSCRPRAAIFHRG